MTPLNRKQDAVSPREKQNPPDSGGHNSSPPLNNIAACRNAAAETAKTSVNGPPNRAQPSETRKKIPHPTPLKSPILPPAKKGGKKSPSSRQRNRKNVKLSWLATKLPTIQSSTRAFRKITIRAWFLSLLAFGALIQFYTIATYFSPRSFTTTNDNLPDSPMRELPGSDSQDQLESSIIEDPDFNPNMSSMFNLPILVVGGSDGSGTRSFVDTLTRLGVNMVVDDKMTLDIHAEMLFDRQGWPGLVKFLQGKVTMQKSVVSNGMDSKPYRPGLNRMDAQAPQNVTRIVNMATANFDFENLEEPVQQILRTQMSKFRAHYEAKGRKLMRRQLWKQINNSSEEKHPTVTAKLVQYGFKAPVSFMALPVLLDTFSRIKFIHVVRDGRDISVSTNRSPVSKFFASFYREDAARRKASCTVGAAHEGKTIGRKAPHYMYVCMAMQMWNDMNTQVLEWCKSQQKKYMMQESLYKVEEQNTTTTEVDAPNVTGVEHGRQFFDYLVVRTEDLLRPETRLATLQRMAKFVGSTITPEQLCCYSRESLSDMGTTPGQRRGAEKDFRFVAGRHQYGQFREKPLDFRNPRRLPYPREDRENIRRMIKAPNKPQLPAALIQPQGELWDRREKPLENDVHRKELEPVQNRLHSAQQQNQTESHNEAKKEEDVVAKNATRNETGTVVSLGNISVQRRLNTMLAIAADRKGRAHESVSQRYGKWATLLEGRTYLLALLHSDGAAGLAAFGYEPAISGYLNLPESFSEEQNDNPLACQNCSSTR